MRGGFIERTIVAYFAIGALWCFIINVGAMITGAPSAFVAVTGSAPLTVKATAVLRIVADQILLWPMDLVEKMGRIAFG